MAYSIISTTRQQITYVYIRETAASNFTLPPSVTQPGDPNEPETTNILSQLDIGDTIFVYDDFYYQIADASEVIIAYYIGSDSDITIPSSTPIARPSFILEPRMLYTR